MSKLLLLKFELQQQLQCKQQLEKDKVRDILDILDLVSCDEVQGECSPHEGHGGEAQEGG